MINRLYTVSTTITAVVMATSELEAERRFRSDFSDIIASQHIDPEAQGEVRSEGDIPEDWSVDCLPFGPKENALTIGEFLDVLPPAVVRDDKTVDMFATTTNSEAT